EEPHVGRRERPDLDRIGQRGRHVGDGIEAVITTSRGHAAREQQACYATPHPDIVRQFYRVRGMTIESNSRPVASIACSTSSSLVTSPYTKWITSSENAVKL